MESDRDIITPKSSPYDALRANDLATSLLKETLEQANRNNAELTHKIEILIKQHQTQVDRLLLAIADAADALVRVLKDAQLNPTDKSPTVLSWLNNFEAIKTMHDSLLTDMNCQRIEPKDDHFDSRLHRIVEMVEDDSLPEGTLFDCAVPGYSIDDRILRRADVRIIRHGISGSQR